MRERWRVKEGNGKGDTAIEGSDWSASFQEARMGSFIDLDISLTVSAKCRIRWQTAVFPLWPRDPKALCYHNNISVCLCLQASLFVFQMLPPVFFGGTQCFAYIYSLVHAPEIYVVHAAQSELSMWGRILRINKTTWLNGDLYIYIISNRFLTCTLKYQLQMDIVAFLVYCTTVVP